MEQKYLTDSNIIIDYAANLLSEQANSFVENIFNSGFIISVVIKIEVLGYDGLPDKIQKLENFLSSAVVISLEDSITAQTIRLRRKYKKLKLGDAIIAATALLFNLTLVTRNTADFKNIDGLKVINPYLL